MRRLSLTSWSLHRDLGAPAITAEPPVDRGIPPPDPGASLTLLDLPARTREAGIDTLEICHFHLHSIAPEYLRALIDALTASEIELFSILIDAGDITHPDLERREADIRMIERWIDAACALGARHARVVAGDAPPDDEQALALAIANLRRLSGYAADRSVRVLTENFRPLASTAANCNRILDALQGTVGLCADIGNFPAERREQEFAAVAGRADSIHAKASYTPDGTILPGQLETCLGLAAGFDGPITLVYDRPGDSWAGIAALKAVVEPFIV